MTYLNTLRTFENIALCCAKYADSIPVVLFLGFFTGTGNYRNVMVMVLFLLNFTNCESYILSNATMVGSIRSNTWDGQNYYISYVLHEEKQSRCKTYKIIRSLDLKLTS